MTLWERRLRGTAKFHDVPWWILHRNGQAFTTFMGLDYSSFQYLLNKFSPWYHRYSPYSVNGKIVTVRDAGLRSGRPHLLSLADCLGLVLRYTRTRGSLFTLQMVFGASHSVFCLFL